MTGKEKKLVSFMEGSDKRFVIPVYQRNYDWKIEECKHLYDDLEKTIHKNRKSHFFGSIVSIHNNDFAEYSIIDGQQRLTTISLLLLAMYNLLKSGAVQSENEKLAKKILCSFLIDEYSDDENIRIKLKPIKNDAEAFKNLFKSKEDHIPESNLTINYNYFCTRILKETLTIDELYTAIKRLEIINISLSQEDNPQLIFESLNSTGLALSEGDKIRNFILMGLEPKIQNEFYNKYWNKIEILTGYDVSSFIRDYLSVVQRSIPSKNKIYFVFKEYVEENDIDIETLLIDLKNYAKRYEVLTKGTVGTYKYLNPCITRLNKLETTVTRPFFLEVLRLNEKGDISNDDVLSIFHFTESYLVRRNICGIATNALNKIFLTLNKEIERLDDDLTSNYFEKFKYILLTKTDNGRFPDDNEFVEAFSVKQVYLMNSKNKIYLLERFENSGTIEDKDIYRHCDEGTYSVEHVMPQTLTALWAEELGENYESIHEAWVNRIANLTLTGYNSKYSNRPFIEKRDIPEGFANSGLRLNSWIAQQEKWTLEELEKRNERLMQQAKQIWPFPITDYMPSEKQFDHYALSDDVDLRGRELLSFEYKSIIQPVNSWASMYEQVIKMLYEKDPSILYSLSHITGDGNELSDYYISNNVSNLRVPSKIADNIFIEKNIPTQSKASVLRKLFKLYDEDPDDLVFYLKDSNDSSANANEGKIFETRRRYWEFALPYIYKAHGEKGSFRNVNPTKENWINGFFGVQGFSIACVALINQARVEIDLKKSDEVKNKSAFDYLYAHKSEIESKLGSSLEWSRSDEYISSYVHIRLLDVSVNNETDWIQMAKFHAEWSKKFYDVIIPYLIAWDSK